MERIRVESIRGPIRLLFEAGAVAGLSDGELLDRFLDRRGDEGAAEVAFAGLVERHGPMVLRACRASLGDEHDAQDAFQATFLILARRAAAIRRRDSAASWLRGVARRVASCSRKAAARRRSKEREAASRRPESIAEADRSGLMPAILEEVADLPEADRAPLRLCLLDGLTHEEAASRLGWPIGTVKTRVRRAKGRLRAALARRGLAPSLGAIAAASASRDALAMPASLVEATARAAIGCEMGRTSALLSASVAALVELGVGSLIMTRWKIATLAIASLGLLAAGAATTLARPTPGPQEKEKPVEASPAERAAEVGSKPADVGSLEDDPLEQVEMARIELEAARQTLEEARHRIVVAIKVIEPLEGKIAMVRTARSFAEVGVLASYTKSGEDLETLRKRVEAELVGQLEQQRDLLKRSRSKYLELRRKLDREQDRVKSLEARSAQAGSPPAEGGSTDADRLDRWKLAKIGVDVLRMDVERWRQRLEASHRRFFDARDQRKRSSRIEGMSEQTFKEESIRLDRDQKLAEGDLEDAQASFLTVSRQLVGQERELSDMAKGLPTSSQADPSRATTGPKGADPTATVDRRLSDVERKLDLILEALGKPSRTPAGD